jgi:hypothetical protein
MRNVFAALSVLLLALGCACGGGSRSNEPPPRQPDDSYEPAQRGAPDESTPADDRFAQPPPGADLEQRAPLPEASESESARASSGPGVPEAAAPSGSGWGSLGSDRDAAEKGAPSARRADGAASAAQRSRAPMLEPPRERPGLATHWGETRYSPAHEVSFEREDASSPTALAELRYNDRSGARRLLPNGHWGSGELTLLGGALRVRMLDANGRSFPALREGSRVVSMGEPGERYSLSIENRTGRRYEVVASVDGLDVLDGREASPDKRGYLIAAYTSVLIDGFRRSDDEVAAFRLGDVAHSYAASQGNARNVGVIGVAVFAERQPIVYAPRPVRPWEDTSLRESADPFPGRYARPPQW